MEFIAETTDTEYKISLEEEKPKSWLKSISAFANGLGGIVYFGIKDITHEIVGINNSENTISKISELIKAKISPMPKFTIGVVKIEDKDIIKIEVDTGVHTPYYYVNEGTKIAYIRIGNESVQCPDQILHELILKGTKSSYDAEISKYKFRDYSFTLLKATYKHETRKDFLDKYFVSFGLVDEESGNLTYAGVLLADECPLKHSKLVCTRWGGLTKASGLMDAIDDQEFQGNIIYLLKSGKDFIKRHNRVAFKKLPTKRENYPDYEERATTEILTNAIIHRSYLEIGSEVHIDIFDDRMDISSPGGMTDGSLIQNSDIVNIPSMRRNPIIASIFTRLDYMETRGSGFEKILEAVKNPDNAKFYSTHSYFIATLKNMNYGNELLNGAVNVGLNVGINVGLNNLENDILNHIKNNNKISAIELSRMLKISSRQVERIIGNLKERSFIERIGAKKTGYWKVIK